MAIDVPAETKKLADTQLCLNTGPNGSGHALYMIGANSIGDYWLGCLTDPDNPNIQNWIPDVASFTNIGFRSDQVTAQQYRLLNHRVDNYDYLESLQTPVCCEDMVKAKDQSATITAECDLTWTPGDNPFWNTFDTVYVATELKIKAGVDVIGNRMNFKFAENAVLVIEATASFKCTDCHFTTACPDVRWKGIEVRGNSFQNQFPSYAPTHQGKLALYGSTVENAEIGILAGSRTAVKGSTGAVIQLNGGDVLVEDPAGVIPDYIEWQKTMIRNCRQGLKFMPYQNRLPNNDPYRNFSAIYNTMFTVDTDYPVAFDFMHHVYMWRVDGIPYRSCVYENTLADNHFANSGSNALGYGIYSLDAHYTVSSLCDDPFWPPGPIPCPMSDKTEFIGLDHGIHARVSTTQRNFEVKHSKFTNNIAGVYAEGVIGYAAFKNEFRLGNRQVPLTNLLEAEWNDHHRGIYSVGSYNMIVEQNEFWQQGPRTTEGIVIGYSRNHNDIIFRNTAHQLNRGFIGEGICADETNKPFQGLIFQCNKNDDNGINIWSRRVDDDIDNYPHQTIRTNQGLFERAADNEFDREATRLDFKNSNLANVLVYWYAPPDMPYEPLYLTPNLVGVNDGVNGQFTTRPANNCTQRIIPILTDPDYPYENGMAPIGGYLEEQKLEYGNTRYLYDQLINGGDKDEVLAEIMAAWPQDAWDLRNYLLSKSPYLTVDVLKEMMNKAGFPEAMKAEICISNPDATRSEGFLKWLEYECMYPPSQSLIQSIVASWDSRTYRTMLESTLAFHHTEMTQAATIMLAHYSNDTTGLQLDSIRYVWQQIRTTAARYAEALSLLEVYDLNAARAVIEAIPQEHVLRPKELTERDRMLAVIDLLNPVFASDRNEAELTLAEQDQLEQLTWNSFDRAAIWGQNLLCFHYGRCRSPLTGGAEGSPKVLPQVQADEVPAAALKLAPNPSSSWVELSYIASSNAQLLLIRDINGREISRMILTANTEKQFIDVRQWASGTYTIELMSGSKTIAMDRLVVQ